MLSRLALSHTRSPPVRRAPLRLTPDSDGPDPGLAPDPTGLPCLRPSAWSSLPALASRPCHCGPWHTASRLITSPLSTGPLLPVRLGRLGRTTTSPAFSSPTPGPNPHRFSASAASYLAETAVRPGCHLVATGAYDRWATSPSRAALPEPPSLPASGKPLYGGHPTERARRRWGGSTPTTPLLSVWGYYGVQSPGAA